MTSDEFDQAIEAIRQGQITPREDRVIAAVGFIMRELRDGSGDDTWQPTYPQILHFIDGLDKPLRTVLKRVADDVKMKKHVLH